MARKKKTLPFRERIVLVDYNRGFYVVFKSKHSILNYIYYVIEPLNQRLAIQLRDLLKRKKYLRVSVGSSGKYFGYLIYRNNNFIIAPFRDIKFLGNKIISIYYKRRKALELVANTIEIEDRLGSKIRIYYCPLLSRLPDGKYIIHDGEGEKKAVKIKEYLKVKTI